jgi:ATP synthase
MWLNDFFSSVKSLPCFGSWGHEPRRGMLKELRLSYNRTRQAAITKEILEIVGGAGAEGGVNRLFKPIHLVHCSLLKFFVLIL